LLVILVAMLMVGLSAFSGQDLIISEPDEEDDQGDLLPDSLSDDETNLSDPVSPVPDDPTCWCKVTSLDVTKTAVGYWECEAEYNWTLTKEMSPTEALLGGGDYVDVQVWLNATRELVDVLDCEWGVRGVITIENTGEHATANINAWDVIQKRVGCIWVDILFTDIPLAGEIAAGDTVHIPYEITMPDDADPNATYRNVIKVSIDNHPCGYDVFLYRESFSLPGSPTIMGGEDAEATLTDQMGDVPGFTVTGDMDGPWFLDGNASITYTMIITNDGVMTGDCYEFINNATLVENDTLDTRIDDANVTICTVSQPPGEICVFKYEDMNGNGEFDGGDAPISGWGVSLYDANDTLVASGMTNATGEICFGGLEPGDYYVREEVRDGWYGTENGTNDIPVTVIVGESAEVIFGNTQYGKICVNKYWDKDGDGIIDPEDTLLGGVPIELWYEGEMVASGSTVPFGFTPLCFENLTMGTYTVKENWTQTVWYATSPMEYEVIIDESGENITVNFLDTQYAQICVYKFEDMDGSGTQAPGEPSVPGVTINLYNETMVLIATNVTDELGNACFHGLKLGTYYVEEVLPAGWYNSSPLIQMVVLDESGETEWVTFANIEYGQICVFKYEDMDGNGVYDGTDAPLIWNITLLDDEYNVVASGDTGVDGWICFNDLEPGTYYVIEVAVAGWYGTENFTGNVTVSLESGDAKEVWFGNTEYAEICVFKYEDINGNGIYDGDDAPIEGWHINIEHDAYAVPNVDGYTNETGWFCAENVIPGTYWVSEYYDPDWIGIENGSGYSIQVIIESGGSEQVWFGNAELISICGYKLEDVNLNGEFELGIDPGIENWTIELWYHNGENWAVWGSTNTDENGHFCFDDLNPFWDYVIEEELRPNWTAANLYYHYLYPIGSGQDINDIEFLNAQNISICGYKMEDIGLDGWSCDAPVEGWHMYLVVWDPVSGTYVADEYDDTFTDASGHYCFENLNPYRWYMVYEEHPSNWTSSGDTYYWFHSGTDFVSGDSLTASFLNAQNIDICVYKYEDIGLDGWSDSNPPVEGWWIDLYVWDNGWVWVDGGYTNETGTVCFENLNPYLNYTVMEEMRSGWIPYGPTSMELISGIDFLSGDELTVSFLNIEKVSICVFKYEDVNGNGVYDGTDAPLIWNITLLDDEYNVVASGDTGANGWICFSDLEPGTYYVLEAKVTGWYGTENFTGNVTVCLLSGESEEVIFGNAELPTITVHKFYDRNMNGIWDEGEEGIEGWNFDVTFSQGIDSGVTDANGEWYYGYAWPYFTYQFAEESRGGWFPTTPSVLNVNFPAPGADIDLYFGNCQFGAICAYKFNDTNENGIWDDGEGPLSGWTIYLKDMANNTLASGVTDIDGMICFLNLTPGQYLVEEDLPPGWYNVTPKVRLVDLEPGVVEFVYFGNALPSYCLEIIKTGPEDVCWGSEIIWNITVCNCGNEPLWCVKVWDPLTGFSTSIPYLGIGECVSFETGIYVPYGWCQSNWVTNTAYAMVWVEADRNITAEASHTVFVAKPDVDLVKEGPDVAVLGQEVIYEITVINDGNVPLWDIRLTDPQIALDEIIPFLDVGGSITYYVPFTIPEGWECSVITNWAQVEAWYYGEDAICQTVDEDCHEIEIVEASITLVKVGPESGQLGEWVNYTFYINNTGDVDLEVWLYDTIFGDPAYYAGIVHAGECVVVHGSLLLDECLEGDSLTNTATVTGVYSGVEVTCSDSWTMILLPPDQCEP
jgi:uncharacterized protein (DUF2141 family)